MKTEDTSFRNEISRTGQLLLQTKYENLNLEKGRKKFTSVTDLHLETILGTYSFLAV